MSRKFEVTFGNKLPDTVEIMTKGHCFICDGYIMNRDVYYTHIERKSLVCIKCVTNIMHQHMGTFNTVGDITFKKMYPYETPINSDGRPTPKLPSIIAMNRHSGEGRE